MDDKKIPSRKGKVSPTEKRRRKRMASIVPAMKAKKASLSKINKKKKQKKTLQLAGTYAEKGKPAMEILGLQMRTPFKQIGKFGNYLQSKGLATGTDPNFGNPTVKKSIKGDTFVAGPPTEKEYEKLYKQYEGTKITPKDKESIMKKIKTSSKKYGGKIKNRNMGGVIGGGLASQDVTDYLYKYDS